VRLAERRPEAAEAHYTEGELDLEPPEELAIGELDDEAILEEELDNEDLLEEDVDEDILAASLEDLVHGGDDDAVGDARVRDARVGDGAPADEDGDDDEVEGGDLEESLDVVLLDRLALLDDGEPDPEADLDDGVVVYSLLLRLQADSTEVVTVAPCGPDEFVCRACFLVRKRVQLADAAAMACLDCST